MSLEQPAPGQASPISDVDQMEPVEREAFNKLIRPDDVYNADGAYWADLPIGQRLSFIGATDRVESRKELSWLGNMFKNDPLAPVSYYFKNMVLPGAGLGLEG